MRRRTGADPPRSGSSHGSPQLADGVNINRTAVVRAGGALDVAATAYDTAVQQADHYISFWRNRPGDLIEIFELFWR